jgi:RimJ/RimL family protein N-acetyltransferase
MVLREPVRQVAGHIGFHGPPGVRRSVEVGYTVESLFRRQGYAFEAVQALFGWAQREHDIHLFIASIAPDNVASLALARKLGFTQTGSQWDDEDGLELVFELTR